MVIYAETSALVPLYVDEERSETIERYAAGLEDPIAFTPFHRLELRTALRLRIFRRESNEEQIRAALALSEQHVRRGVLQHQPLDWSATLREAEKIGGDHVARSGVRSADLVHISSAVVLEADEFLTFDKRQAELARRVGLKVAAWR